MQPRIEGQEPLNYWTCGRDHKRRDFPHQQEVGTRIYNVQEVSTVGEVAQTVPRFYMSLDNHQEDRKASIIKMEGKLHE